MALDLTYDPNWKPDSKSGDVDLTYDPNWKPQGILGGLGSSLKRGIDSTVDYGKISLTDNPDEIAGIVSENIRNRPQPSAAQQKMNAEIAPYAKEASDAQGIVGNIGAYAKLYGKRAMQLAENPREFAGMVAENLPNSAPGIAGMVAGGAAGAATPVPFGAAIGGVVGGTAGGYKIEQGSSMFDQVVKEAQARGIDTNNKPAMSAMIAEKYPEFLKASQLKGVGTAGTDAVLNVATLGVAGIGERALAREARSVADLAKAGKMTGEEAASAIAGIEAKNAARNTIGQKALRGAGVAAGEMAGESLSEAAGQQLAYGKLDPLDVVDEGLLAFGQGVGMAAGRKFISPLVGATDKDSVTQEIERARAFATALNQSVGGDVNAVPTLITDLGPLQQRIDDLHGIGNARMNDAERAKYEQEFNAAFGEVVGYTTDKDGMEIPFTMGDYLNSQVRSADITRDRPKAANAVQQSESRLQQVADEETTGYVAPEIPVVGTLSAVANMAIKSGAHAQNQMQQAMQAALAKQGKPEKANGPIAAATDAQVATQGAQGAGGNVPGSAGVSPSALAGNQERAGNGAEVAAPGLRPAVSAGIAGVPAGQLTPEVSRAAQPAQVAAQAPQANDAQAAPASQFDVSQRPNALRESAERRKGNATRDDLVGAIMRVTGGRGIAASMAQTVVGDKANNATKVRGLFTNVGVADLDDTATLLRDEEGYDVRDGNHLAELIRSQADGNPVYSTARIEREAAAEAEKRHRDEIRRNAKKFGIKTVARPFGEIEKEVLRRIDERHTEAVNKLDARARDRFDAMLKHAVEVADFDEVDAIITDAQNRFIGREFFTQATRQLRGYIDDLTRERQAQEQSNAIEETQGTSEEPDWLRSGTENPGSRSDPAGTPEGARRQAGQQETGLTLEGQTNEQAAEQFAQQQAAKDKEAADKKAADDKAKADVEANDFRLAGSDRAADVAIAGGQVGLFGADGRATKAADQEPVKNEAPAAATDSEEVKASEQAPIKKDDIAALEADVESAREEWQKSHAEPVRQKLQDARAKLEAAKNATVDSVSQPKTDAAPESDEYESRVKSRIERIKASSDTADIDRILAEEYKDESRHFEGTSSVERAASNRKQDIKIDESKKAVASKRSEQERLVAEYEGGNRSNGAIESISADLREAERTAAFGADTYAESKRWTDNSAEVQRLRGLQARLNSALPEASKPDEDTRFAKNTIFTADKVAAAKARMKAKLGTMNSGIDPELLIDGMTIAGAYIESGVRKFADYAKAMVEDLGDGVKPYLLSFYEAARAYPGLNKMGMDTQEAAAKQHQAILTPEVKAAAKEVIGESPKVEKKKPANLGEAVRLKADWGVKNIDGYTRSKTGKNQETDYGLKGGIKDEFLTDAKRYLKAVSKLLEDQGFETHVDNRGKGIAAVNSNEAGPAVSGDVYLAMRRGDFGVYAEVGVSSVRGIGPNHPQGVSLMVRVTPQAKNDRTASKGMNNWLATDLSAGDLAAWFNKATAAAVQQAPEKTTGYDLSKADDKFKVATEIADFLIGGGEFKTIIEARKKISEMIGRPIEAATELAKQADETIETAVVLAGRDIVKAGRKQGRSAEVIYDRLVDLYRRQPNLAVRSSTSVRDQAYSTPVPLAYLASELAGINYDTKVLEPTAGNGMLLIGASTGNAVVNELNADRADVLRSLGFNPTERNAATEQLRHSGYPVDAVIANPPFGATKDANGDTIIYDVKPGFQTSEVDHAIVFKSLETMKDDGRAVLIVGGVQSEEEEYRREDYRGKNKRTFYYNLYNEYNVIDHFTADGGLYSKQGASYPVDIIVIDGRGKSSRDMPAADIPVIFKSYDALKEKLNGNGRVESKPVVGASGTDSGNGQSGQGDTPGLAGSTIGTGSNDGKASADRIGAEGVRNDGSTDNGRPSGSGTVSSGGQSESANTSGTVNGSTVSDANRNAESGSKASNRGNRLDDLGGTSVVNGERVESGLTDRRGQEQETGHQVAYSPHSNAASVGTLVPRAMKDSIAASLQKISDEVGSIDDYVAESLAMDVEDVKSNFSAEQIDALALAIRNAEAGKGFIIGDQTGIGKGRVVAAMIRYALVTGKTPIFVTEKPNLYSDMIRDLDDIGMTAELALDTKNPKVLITNGGESIPYTLLRTEKGEVVENNLMLRAPKAGKALDQLMQSMMSGESLGEYKVIFTTYSQLQTVKGATTTRQRFIQQFGEGNYMVFDESHNAGGAGETQARTKEQRQAEKDGQILVTGRAAFVRNLVQRAFGTFFSSATYAKRPDVMDLYSSTNMKLAVDRISQLGEAIKSGGVPMQQVVANMLTKDGQYIRRERTFAGVSYDTQETKVDKETAENMASAMRSILAFSRAKESVLKEMQKEMDREGGMLREMGGEKSSVQGANFGSIMHNLIDQMLLSLKVHDSVKHAIDRLKAGEKVVMTVSNTMGSFLEDYSEELGLSAGDPVSMSFADLYNRYLEKQRNVTIKDGAGNKRQHRLTDAELGPRLVDMFNAVLKQIDSSGFGSAPISPIDYMHNELRKAGYKTDEITGRTIALNYSSGTPILASRSANIRQRVKAVSGFNNGDTDVLILNQAGSTGLSLHASSKFKDKRKRHMIIVQAEKNIDTHMQMLGRVHRTGQVVAPAYSQMMADIPAEMRPASVLMKKMASLNANTTASRSSSVTAEGVVDFMNDYGGQVVHEYLRDNPDVLEAVGGNKVISLADDPAEAGEDDIRKFTGYIPILPIKQQEGVYRELVDRYNELIERENSLGTNKLEAKAVDLDAETISSQPVTENRGDHSVFAAPANMEKVDVKRTVKPYSSEEVSAMVAESLGGKRSYEIASQQSADLTDKATAYGREKVAKMTADGVDPVKIESQKAQLNLVLSHAKTVLSTYRIGDSISIKDQAGQFLYGVITNVEHSGRTANPAAGSAWKMHIALANGDAKSITISFSQIGSKYELRTETNVDWYNIETQSVDRIPVLDIFDKGSKVRREKRWIVTGNILAGFARFPGQIITYTKNDGTTAQGVLMSRQFDFEKEQKNAPVRIKDGNAAINLFTNGGPGVIIGTPDRNLMVAIRRGEYEITVPSSKKDGGTYYLDRGLTNIVGDFYKRGSIMSASVYTTGDLERMVNYLVKDREENIIALSNVENAKELLEGNSGAGNIASPGSMSPADKDIYGMAAEGKSAAKILKFIASASRSPFYRQLAKLLLKTGIAPQVMASTTEGWRFNAGNDKKYAAAYNESTNTIALFRPAAAERNFLHEAMHAATIRALGKKGLAAGQMKALFEHVKKDGGLKGMYGMSDIDEFVAEAFSNPKFQDALKKIAAPKASGSTLSSAWHWFVRIVRGILGIPQGQENALSQAIEIGLGVMKEDMAVRRVDNLPETAGIAERNDYVNRAIEQWAAGELESGTVISLGKPSAILRRFGVPDLPIQIEQGVLAKAIIEKHDLLATDLKDITVNIQAPIAVFKSKIGDNKIIVVTEVRHRDGNVIAALHLGAKRNRVDINDIRSLHPKRDTSIAHWIEDGLLLGVDKHKGRDWLENSAGSNSRQYPANAALDKAILYDGRLIRKAAEAVVIKYAKANGRINSDIRYNVADEGRHNAWLESQIASNPAYWRTSREEIARLASERRAFLEKQASGRTKFAANKAKIELARNDYASLIESAHRIRSLEFKPLSSEAFNARDTLLIHQSPSYGKSAGSSYRLVLVNGEPAYARDSNHWGKFSTNDFVNGEQVSSDYDWRLDGVGQTKFGDKQRYAGYVLLRDLKGAPTPNSTATQLPGAPEQSGMQERTVRAVNPGSSEPAQFESGAGSDANLTLGREDGNGIRYNVADEGWSVSEPSKMDDLIYALQDKQIDMKRVVQSIMRTGKKVKDEVNAYLQEELFHGRAAKGVKDFLDFELRPLLKQMQDAKVDMGDFEEYLWNRHAEERNKQIAKINPDMPDGGSGIETAKARAYLAGLSAEQRKTFEMLAAKVEAMNRQSQRVLVESGLEKQSTIDAWNGAYQHYVPLQRDDVDSGHVGTGKGFSVRGSSSKRAMGSGKKVVDIIANLTMQRERNIVRAEKNRVSNALLGLAVQNPNPDFWKVDQAPKERVVQEKAIYTVLDSDGNKIEEFTRMDEAERLANKTPGAIIDQTWGDRVTERVMPGFTSRDNVLLTRINGEDHYVIFNERDERAMRMATAMKNLDMDNLGRVLSVVGKATRYLASINTQYNPVFGVINLVRDTQGALINLSSTPLAGEQKRVLGYTKDALVGIYKDIRAHRAGGKPSSNWAALFEEFQKEGGQTGYRDQYANAEARAESIKSELEQFKDGKAKQLARGLFGWLSDYNETMENAVRLAAYKAAKDKGMSNQQAASLAKNITVNFNRKGQMATQVGALYAFFNASVQGSARIAETLFEQHGGDIKNVRLSKKGKQILAGGIMLGAMQALLLAAAGFDDDEPPEFIRERNLILPIGGGKYLTLAMPLGLHVIPGIGRIATEFVLSGGKDPLKRIAAFGSMFADAFNPIGSAGWSLQTITPSVVDPFAALAENKDFTGKEIYREDFNKLNPTPGHARAKDVATFYSRAISEALNFITGGSEFKPGLVSWSPDSIDYLIGQVTGGVGREANKALQTAGSAYSGEDLPLYKIPLVGRFVGDTAGQSGQSAKFYDAIKQINMHEAQYKGLIKDGRSAEAREYLAENPAVRLIMAGNHAELAVRKLRTMKRDLVENDADQDKIRAIDARITETMRRFNERAGAFI